MPVPPRTPITDFDQQNSLEVPPPLLPVESGVITPPPLACKTPVFCAIAASEPMHQSKDIRELLRACATGDALARRAFQDEYGEDIYNFPVTHYRLPAD